MWVQIYRMPSETISSTPLLEAKIPFGKWIRSMNQSDHPKHLAATYYTSKGSLRNFQSYGDWFTVCDQVLQDAAGQQDLFLRALQQETYGPTSRLPWIWQNPHMSSRLLGHLKQKATTDSNDWFHTFNGLVHLLHMVRFERKICFLRIIFRTEQLFNVIPYHLRSCKSSYPMTLIALHFIQSMNDIVVICLTELCINKKSIHIKTVK